MLSKSLTFRIIALSSFWIVMALFLTASLLAYYYRDHIAKHYDAHVFMHLEEMVAASHLSPQGELQLSYYPSDPRFDILYSGWYWEIRHHGKVLGRSHSLGGETLDLGGLQVTEGTRIHHISGPRQEPLRIQTLEIPAGPAGERLMLVATAPMLGIKDDVIDIAEHMLVSFVLLAAVLILAVVLQVRLALRPLKAVSSGIARIRGGRAERLEGDFPEEVQPLVDELNNLLEHSAVLLKRARNQLGDLAHSIKNPLTVINNEAGDMEEERRELLLKQTTDIAASVEHYLSRARVFGTENVLGARSQVKAVAEDLVFVMQRIYKERKLEFDLSGLGNCAFRGESQDLEEMLGNLLDNASKWASKRVIVHCKIGAHRVRLAVEDDGPGIPEVKTEMVLERGGKLDDTVAGQGRGLGIVRDIVGLYGGSLTLSQSGYGGLCAELDLPGA
jgi:signal transduction histidine kinase